MSHFYLTLPSNASMGIYPGNTVAKYTTQLANGIELDGDWEVALTEIMYPNNWFNLYGEWIRYYRLWEWSRRIPFPDGYYPSTEKLIEKLKETFNCPAAHSPMFSLQCVDKKCMEITCRDPRVNFGFEMSPRLKSIFGLDDYDVEKFNEKPKYTFRGKEMKPEIGGDITSLYLYCDILEHVPVGDTMAPLLRCINVRGNHGDRICETFTSPMYLPVQKKVFDSVEINIMTDTGDPVPFISGRSTVTLHFRRTRNPYFLSK